MKATSSHYNNHLALGVEPEIEAGS